MARQYDYRISGEIWCLEGARGFGLCAGGDPGVDLQISEILLGYALHTGLTLARETRPRPESSRRGCLEVNRCPVLAVRQ